MERQAGGDAGALPGNAARGRGGGHGGRGVPYPASNARQGEGGGRTEPRPCRRTGLRDGVRHQPRDGGGGEAARRVSGAHQWPGLVCGQRRAAADPRQQPGLVHDCVWDPQRDRHRQGAAGGAPGSAAGGALSLPGVQPCDGPCAAAGVRRLLDERHPGHGGGGGGRPRLVPVPCGEHPAIPRPGGLQGQNRSGGLQGGAVREPHAGGGCHPHRVQDLRPGLLAVEGWDHGLLQQLLQPVLLHGVSVGIGEQEEHHWIE
mmetsp:Transcript_54373/g.172733  ORF Transcript_54373/g.172733 Transcript_54373/m.172733 type:complete len:259 (+) Transcript_54373:243-1019(+)